MRVPYVAHSVTGPAPNLSGSVGDTHSLWLPREPYRRRGASARPRPAPTVRPLTPPDRPRRPGRALKSMVASLLWGLTVSRTTLRVAATRSPEAILDTVRPQSSHSTKGFRTWRHPLRGGWLGCSLAKRLKSWSKLPGHLKRRPKTSCSTRRRGRFRLWLN